MARRDDAPPGATGPATSSAVAAAVARPASTDEVAARRPGGRRRRPDGQAGRHRPLVHRRRRDHRRPAGARPADRAGRASTRRPKLVRVRAGTPLHRAQRRAGRGTAWPCPTSATSTCRPSPARSPPAPTAPAPGTAACPPSSRSSSWSPAPARWCAARATANPDLFAAALVGVGALGVVTEVTLRCVDAFILHADERPTPLADVLASLDERIADNDHFEFYWCPYTERTLTKSNNRVPADDRPRGRFAGWFNDDFLANTVFGGVCRLGRAVPAADPDAAARPPRRRSPPATTPSAPTWSSPRRGGCASSRWSTACPAPRCPRRSPGCAGSSTTLPVKVALPGRGAVHRRRRHLAVPRVRAGQRLHRDPPVRRACRTSRTSAAFEAVCSAAGRPAALGQDALPRRRRRCARPTRASTTSSPCATRLDPDRVFANDYTGQVFGDLSRTGPRLGRRPACRRQRSSATAILAAARWPSWRRRPSWRRAFLPRWPSSRWSSSPRSSCAAAVFFAGGLLGRRPSSRAFLRGSPGPWPASRPASRWPARRSAPRCVCPRRSDALVSPSVTYGPNRPSLITIGFSVTGSAPISRSGGAGGPALAGLRRGQQRQRLVQRDREDLVLVSSER